MLHVHVPDAIGAYKFYGLNGDPDLFYYDKEWYDYLNKHIPKRVWVGVNPMEGMINIPNYYEFVHNSPLHDSPVIGFAARTETRKAVHFLQNHESIAFTNPIGFRKWEQHLYRRFDKTKLIRFDYNHIDRFFASPEWGVFHGAYYREPFGYSIFQAVDHGKLPIIAHDWCPELRYRYRASTHAQFDEIVDTINSDPYATRLAEFESIKSHMVSRFGDKRRWVHDILKIYNE